jgi:hypothetical protein
MSISEWVDPILDAKIRRIRKYSRDKLVIIYDNKTGKLKEFQIISKPLEKPSDKHKEWLGNHIQEEQQIEEFKEIRMICSVCGVRIKDDKYLVLSDPEDPKNPANHFYIHSKGECVPRKRKIRIKRERWLDNRLQHI